MKTQSFSLFALAATLMLSLAFGTLALAAADNVENNTMGGQHGADFKKDTPKEDKKVQDGGPSAKGAGTGVEDDSMNKNQADFKKDSGKEDKKVQDGGVPSAKGAGTGVENDKMNKTEADDSRKK